MQHIFSAFSKSSKSLLVLLACMFSFTACNTPQMGVSKQQTYGGQISGQIEVYRSGLSAVFPTPEDLVAYLQENLRVQELVIEDYQAGELLSTDYKMGDCNVIDSKVKPSVRISQASTTDKLIIEYSVGIWSNKPIMSRMGEPNTLTVDKPYRVFIDPKYNGNEYLSFFESRQHTDQPYTVVYLTECDRVFECYNFQTKRGYLG